MIEYFLLPAVAIGAALIPKKKLKDKQKIMRVIKSKNLCVEQTKYPLLIRNYENESHSTYIFSLPFGLSSESFDNILPEIEEALNKDVEAEFKDGIYKLDVYNESLPQKWSYTDELLRPNTWLCAIGKNHKGVMYHDFEKYPHMLIGGVTRFGKTVFLKSLLNSLILNNPDHVEIYILDLKAGLEFYKFKALPQVKEVATDVYESAEVLMELTEQLQKEKDYFRENGYTNVVDTPIKKRRFIIVDEGAELSPNIIKNKDAKKYAEYCQGALSEIARIGGGIGYRLIYATQYPVKEAVPIQVKMNIVARVAFLCTNNVSSRVVLDDVGAEDLPAIPGRAIYMVDKKRTLQTPYINDKTMFNMMEGRKDAIEGKNRIIINND